MIKSKHFWMAALSIAFIPLLLTDIAQHYLDWNKEVREEIITVVQNVYSFDKQQKIAILDRVFERNQTLVLLISIKSIIVIVLAGLGFYFFRLYHRRQQTVSFKPLIGVTVFVFVFFAVKFFVINPINTNRNIHFLELDAKEASLKSLYNQHFKGKLVYVDFWGTTCGPCLQEFRNFTQPLKDKFKSRQDIVYLYVAQGNKYLWHDQINKYKVEGFHVFVNESQYVQLYRQSTKGSTGVIMMPHYVIFDKKGNAVVTNAKQPSDRTVLYEQLNKYLAQN